MQIYYMQNIHTLVSKNNSNFFRMIKNSFKRPASNGDRGFKRPSMDASNGGAKLKRPRTDGAASTAAWAQRNNKNE